MDRHVGAAAASRILDWPAGVRLSRAERLLPRLKEAVCARFIQARDDEEIQERMHTQLRVLRRTSGDRWPDAFLAWDEAVEDAMQRASAGVRAVRVMKGEPYEDPFELEQRMGTALLDDPGLSLALERTRQPRPNLPPPPPRGDSLWEALRIRAEGGSFDETGIHAAICQDGQLQGTVSIMSIENTPTVEGGPYSGWRLIGCVEQRAIAKGGLGNGQDEIATRFRVVELRVKGDRKALTLPPVSTGDLAEWTKLHLFKAAVYDGSSTQPVVGFDPDVQGAGDGHNGLGILRNLFTPTSWLVSTIELGSSSDFILADRRGEALALITWRTEYETSDYELTWPRLYGTGLVVRSDVFGDLISAAGGRLTFRDFVEGPSTLCADTSGRDGRE